jgi:hypothetical protein
MSDIPGSGFGKFVPGFEFLQNLAGQAASGVAQGLGSSLPQMPSLAHWVAPTFNVEDLEKRIEELKAVHFWLDQNSKALGATIQALEVQKMTLATLKTMNFNLGDVANAFKIKAADTVAGFTGSAPAHTPSVFAGLEVPERTRVVTSPQMPQKQAAAPEPAPSDSSAAAKAAAEPAAGGLIDPMHWWGALSQQFQTIATNAMKDVAKQAALDTTREAASGLTSQAVKTVTDAAGKMTRDLTGTVSRNVGAATNLGQAAARAVTPRRRAAPKTSAAPAPESAAAGRRARADAGAGEPPPRAEWPIPTAFFQMPGFAMGGASEKAAEPKRAAAKKAAAKSGNTATRKAAVKKPAARASAKTPARKAPSKKTTSRSQR